MNQEDQRVIRTRQQLQNSFITLVNERDFDQVTIRDVTTHANVGYRTFFRHYKDTRALMEDALSNFTEEVLDLLVPPNSFQMIELNVVTMYRYIEKNADLFRAYCRSPYFEESNAMRTFFRKASRNVFKQSPMPSELIDAHFFYASMNHYRWWVESGMHISAEEMGRYTHKLILMPLITTVENPIREWKS